MSRADNQTEIRITCRKERKRDRQANKGLYMTMIRSMDKWAVKRNEMMNIRIIMLGGADKSVQRIKMRNVKRVTRSGGMGMGKSCLVCIAYWRLACKIDRDDRHRQWEDRGNVLDNNKQQVHEKTQ